MVAPRRRAEASRRPPRECIFCPDGLLPPSRHHLDRLPTGSPCLAGHPAETPPPREPEGDGVTGPQATGTERTALSRELGEFLIELSIGVHRHAIYPEGHPSLEPVADNILARLGTLFRERSALAIGVAERQLVIDGIATDQRHPVLADLSRRLHDHQLGAVSFHLGVTSREITGLLEALATDVDRGHEPLGLMTPEARPSWTHARVHPVGYDKLEMRQDQGAGVAADRASLLWLGLARAALDDDEVTEVGSDPESVARGIREHEREAAYDQVIVGYLLQLADELSTSEGRESKQVRRKLSKLVRGLDEDTLSRLVQFGGSRAQRRRFLLDANQTLSAESVVRLVEAAAAADEQSISHAMTRMLTKLSSHAAHGRGRSRQEADSALREHIEGLLTGWELPDPNPGRYTSVLEAMSKAAPVFHLPEGETGTLSEAERILDMALELDTWGPMPAKALESVIRAGGLADLLERVVEEEDAPRVAFHILGGLTEPERFKGLLAEGLLDESALEILLEKMADTAIDPMLDVLLESDSRAVRRGIFDTLQGMGPEVARLAIRRLNDTRWFVLRNMIALLGRIEHLPDSFDPAPYLDHPDVRVRREALLLALRRPSTRTRTLAAALADPDERMVRIGLVSLRHGVPEAVLPTLVHRVVKNPDRSAELRALGVRMLATVRSSLVLNTLLDVATSGKTLFGRPRLAPSAPDVLVALRGLSKFWPDVEEVRELVQQAARAKDPEVRAAAVLESPGPATDAEAV